LISRGRADETTANGSDDGTEGSSFDCSRFGFFRTFSRPVTAAEFFLMPESNQLYMLGETTFGDFDAFKEFVERDKVQTVVLSGPGGDLDEAFEIWPAAGFVDTGLS
jgi:hypothetical protein